MTTKDVYIARMKVELDELNTKMSHLETRAAEAKEEARDRFRAQMIELRKQSSHASAKLNELMAASESSWDAMVAEMDKLANAFKHSFSYFKSQV